MSSSESLVESNLQNTDSVKKENMVEQTSGATNDSTNADSWHSSPHADVEARRVVINLVVQLLEACKPAAFEDKQEKLIDLARRLEVALYKQAKTRDEYMNRDTLKNRVRELAKVSTQQQPQQPRNNASSTNANEGGPANALVAATNGDQQRNNNSSNPKAPGVSANDGEQRLQILKQRQQRLLLLRHASKCSAKEGKCQITPHCFQMKTLWKHIGTCKDVKCSVPHCVSSRYVLVHYYKCNKDDCLVCQPVKLVSQRSMDKRRNAYMQSHGTYRITNNNNTTGGQIVINGANQIDPRYARACISGTGPSFPLSMTSDKILTHLKALKIEWLQYNAMPMLRKLMGDKKFNKGAFNEPVDPIALNIPHYTKMIKNPMDFGTIRKKLEDFKYQTLPDFIADIDLVFKNALTFNAPENEFHQRTQAFYNDTKKHITSLDNKMASRGRKKGERCPLCFEEGDCTICHLCGRSCISFEPKALFCSGNPKDNCQSGNNGRIARNANYYTGAGSNYVWCTDCYDKHRGEYVTANGERFSKSVLVKKKNNDLFAEPWVECDECQSWVHQVCALFNPRKNAGDDGKYVCPTCLVSKRKVYNKSHPPETAKSADIKDKTAAAESKTDTKEFNKPLGFLEGKHVPGVKDLEHSRLGIYLEKWVRDRIDKFHQAEKENPPDIDPGDPGPDSSKFHVRIMSNVDEKCVVKPSIRPLLLNYPEQFDYRSRCILLFQELDGVEVLFFAMFVQEYGADCPKPNSRKVYIAYLDSVYYFRPRRLRTLVYHELLLAYLEYSRRNGFTSAYIWACPPPNTRDDYIIHCHPEDQRVQTPDRLRKWYHVMIQQGVSQNIFTSSCSLYEEHFEASSDDKKNNSKKATKGKKSNNYKKGKKGKSKGEKSGGMSALNNADSYMDDDNDELNIDMVDLPCDELCDDMEDGGDCAPPPTSALVETLVAEGVFVPSGKGALAGDNRNYSQDVERRKREKLNHFGNLPYFEGDYWPQEAEDVAKTQEEKKKSSEVGRGQRKRRRNGEEEDPNEQGDDPKAGKNEKDNAKTETVSKMTEEETKEAREQLAKKLSSQLMMMKDDFLVVKMAFECARCGIYLIRGRWECRHPDCRKESGFDKNCTFALCNDCYKRECDRPVEHQHGGGCVAEGDAGLPKDDESEALKNSGSDQEYVNVNAAAKEAERAKAEAEKKAAEDKKNAEESSKNGQDTNDTKRMKVVDGDGEAHAVPPPQKDVEMKDAAATSPVKTEPSTDADVSVKTESTSDSKDKKPEQTEEEKKKAEEERKANLEKEYEEWSKQDIFCTRPQTEDASDHILYYVDENAAVRTCDYDRLMKHELLESRHAFLSLCTGNRYQFDQLRRAKHSTMMVLYHLHNPDAPAHLFTCEKCQTDILSGKRYHCDICLNGDFNLCAECHRTSMPPHEHTLTPIAVTRGVNAETSDAQRAQRIAEQLRARRHSLALFHKALVHSSTCADPHCKEPACPKMKGLLKHRQTCEVRVRGGCDVCRRVLCLVQMHAKICKIDHCRVPHCEDLKRHMRQQQHQAYLKQQQAEQRAAMHDAAPQEAPSPRDASATRGRGRGRGGIANNSGVTVVEGSGGIKLKIRASSNATTAAAVPRTPQLTGPASSRSRGGSATATRVGRATPKK